MSAVLLLDGVVAMEEEHQRKVKTVEGKEVNTSVLYETGKNSIDSCVTEEQFKNALRYILIIDKIDTLIATALYYYYKVKSKELEQI
jgi:hypothetical protein